MKMQSLRRTALLGLGMALALSLTLPVAMARGSVHLHIEVTDEETGEMRFKLDTPITAIDAILDALHDQMDGGFDLDFAEMSGHGMDIHKMWMALRDEDLGDFLEVNDGEEHIRVWKDREAFQVRVTKDGESRPTVMVYLPIPVLDALFSGAGDAQLDLQAALRELEAMAPITLVEVYDDDETVRIWLD